MSVKIYSQKIYPLQNKILKLIENLQSPFYLTGGTALSRVYLNHRYSEYLDLFLNASKTFKKDMENILSAFRKDSITFEIANTADHFLRLFLKDDDIELKIDFVNDVEFHHGDIVTSEIYYRVDNPLNILSNKICALSRMDIKDVVDLCFLCRQYKFNWYEMIADAKMKDTWVNEVDVSRIITEFSVDTVKKLYWISIPNTELIIDNLILMASDILHGRENSLPH